MLPTTDYRYSTIKAVSNRASYIRYIIAGIYLICVSLTGTQSLHAQSDTPSLADLSLDGWTRDVQFNGIKIDQYRTETGSINIDLMAFPPTDQTASQWIDSALKSIVKVGEDAGSTVMAINNDDLKSDNVKGPMNSSGDGVDTATRTISIIQPGGAGRICFV